MRGKGLGGGGGEMFTSLKKRVRGEAIPLPVHRGLPSPSSFKRKFEACSRD